MPVAAARRLQSVRNGRTLWHMRVVALLAVVLFLVTEGKMLTGEEIIVDGGLVRLGPRS